MLPFALICGSARCRKFRNDSVGLKTSNRYPQHSFGVCAGQGIIVTRVTLSTLELAQGFFEKIGGSRVLWYKGARVLPAVRPNFREGGRVLGEGERVLREGERVSGRGE